MFTNFEICKAGLITTTPTRRHQRTTTGCIQCRQRKKKCDEQLPKCSLCLKYGTFCERRQNARRQSYSSSEAPLLDSVPSPDSNLEAREYAPVLVTGSRPIDNSLSRKPQYVASTYSFERTRDTLGVRPSWTTSEAAVTSFKHNLRTLEMVVFSLPNERLVVDFFIDKIDEITMPSYINPKTSILYHALPVAIVSPAVKNAMMACGFALLSQSSTADDRSVQAKSYQCKALNQLAGHILHGPEEINLGTILLLHLFEKICCDSAASKRLHLLGAKSLIAMTQKTTVTTKLNPYLLEAYIYHITLSSTFSGVVLPPFQADHVSKLMKLLETMSQDPKNLWKDSSLIGVCHGLYDAIFQISLLRRQLPLTISDQLYAKELRDLVSTWKWSSPQEDMTETVKQDDPKPLEAMIKAGHLYQLACLLLIEKILNPSLNAADQVSRRLVTRFCEIIRQFLPEQTKQSVHLWPLLIMGPAAQTSEERQLFLAPLQNTQHTFGFGNRNQGCTFLIRSWGAGESSDEALGLDILLRDDLLCEIFI